MEVRIVLALVWMIVLGPYAASISARETDYAHQILADRPTSKAQAKSELEKLATTTPVVRKPRPPARGGFRIRIRFGFGAAGRPAAQPAAPKIRKDAIAKLDALQRSLDLLERRFNQWETEAGKRIDGEIRTHFANVKGGLEQIRQMIAEHNALDPKDHAARREKAIELVKHMQSVRTDLQELQKRLVAIGAPRG